MIYYCVHKNNLNLINLKNMTVNGKKVCLWTVVIIFGVVALGLIVLTCTLTPLSNSMINSQVDGNVFLKTSNTDDWGEIPGKRELNVKRGLTVFNFTNAENVALHDEKPVFQLTPEVPFKELQSVSNLAMLENGDKVSFSQTVSTVAHNLTDAQTALLGSEMTIPNVAAIGVWNVLKNYNDSQITAGAIAGIMSSTILDNSMLNTAISEAAKDMFIVTREQVEASIFQNVEGLTQEQKDSLWSDTNYGMATVRQIVYWIKATLEGIESTMTTILTNHFYLTRKQAGQILDALQAPVQAAMSTAINTFKCPNNICTSKYLIAVQWASQNVTQGVPIASIAPTPSICSVNQTIFGYPEFSYYYKE